MSASIQKYITFNGPVDPNFPPCESVTINGSAKIEKIVSDVAYADTIDEAVNYALKNVKDFADKVLVKMEDISEMMVSLKAKSTVPETEQTQDEIRTILQGKGIINIQFVPAVFDADYDLLLTPTFIS